MKLSTYLIYGILLFWHTHHEKVYSYGSDPLQFLLHRFIFYADYIMYYTIRRYHQ